MMVTELPLRSTMPSLTAPSGGGGARRPCSAAPPQKKSAVGGGGGLLGRSLEKPLLFLQLAASITSRHTRRLPTAAVLAHRYSSFPAVAGCGTNTLRIHTGGGVVAQGLGIRLFAFGGAYWPLATAHPDPLWVRTCFGRDNGAPG